MQHILGDTSNHIVVKFSHCNVSVHVPVKEPLQIIIGQFQSTQ